MIVCAMLCVLGALLKGEAKILHSRASVAEGGTLTLRCAFPGSDGSAMQWLTPKGYVTFFNSEKVLKDQRFQLVRSSQNRLVISISNVTGDDEGVYTCLHYSMPVEAKKVNVTVWAAPSRPVIEVTQIPEKSSRGEIVLNCSTSGGRPCPRITWLVGHSELPGKGRSSFLGGGRKCAASSTLRISAFTHRSTFTCVVRQRSFSGGNSTATFTFTNLVAATEGGNARNGQTMPQTPQSAKSTSMSLSETSSAVEAAMTGRTSEITSMTSPERVTTGETTMTEADEETRTVATTFRSETLPATDNSTQHNVTNAGSNSPDFEFVTETSPTRTIGIEASRKSNNTVILILVSLMICVLLVIVHLFLMKLRKAHQAWKKENENSDQTLESNKSKSNNEEAPGPTRNIQVPTNQNGCGIKYNTQVSM